MTLDLLADLARAVERALVEHKGLDDFRKNFDAIVARHGWDYVGERNWRTRVIYQTNLLTSYAAGRMAQLKDPKLLKIAPYWRYVHNDSVITPRPHHKHWGDIRLTLRHDHPFWSTHYPPNGWGCRCRVVAERAPKGNDATEPPEGWNAIDPKTDAPVGIDKGWGHAPGATVQDELRQLVKDKASKLPEPLARAFEDDVAAFARSPFEVKDDVAPAFASAVLESYESLPERWRKAVSDAGNRVVVARRLTEVLPRLKGVTPPGYDPSLTWDHADGGFFGRDKVLVIAQESMIKGVFKPVSIERGRGLLFHEFGHALDASLAFSLTQDEDILRAWRQEADKLRSMQFADKDSIDNRDYFVQPEPFGTYETIAELMARMHGYRTAESLDALDYFPKTREMLTQRLSRI
ncbi:MAG: phage minor head protein [Halothiobacillaceae bacterium]|nr:phage minor head protein [Halothiobacillaceae bacterium]